MHVCILCTCRVQFHVCMLFAAAVRTLVESCTSVHPNVHLTLHFTQMNKIMMTIMIMTTTTIYCCADRHRDEQTERTWIRRRILSKWSSIVVPPCGKFAVIRFISCEKQPYVFDSAKAKRKIHTYTR